MRGVQIKKTDDYSLFKYLNTNREVSQGHVQNLVNSFTEYGNFTQLQPVLVNEHFQIIDGQHRFEACKQLDQPIYYSVVPGLTVVESRAMNINHKGWSFDDYLHSYVAEGKQVYKDFEELRDTYGFSNALTLMASVGANNKGLYKAFREGDLVMQDKSQTETRLQMLAVARDAVGDRLGNDRQFCTALLNVSRVPGFEFDRMVKKLKLTAADLLSYSRVDDAQRQLEDVYNRGFSEGRRLRLY